MIKNVNKVCNRLNKALGLSLDLPDPGRRGLKIAAVCNGILGAGLLAAGVVFSSKECASLGGLSLAGSVILCGEGRRKAAK